MGGVIGLEFNGLPWGLGTSLRWRKDCATHRKPDSQSPEKRTGVPGGWLGP